jgi:hypothetical protein
VTRLIVHGPITDDALYDELLLVGMIGLDKVSYDPDMSENEYFIVEENEDE